MADEFEQIGSFLSRWSRRKLAKEEPAPPGEPGQASGPASETGSAEPDAAQVQAPVAGTPPEEPLPPVESLTPESDFTPFMRPQVDAGVKSAALKQLFKDPHFNVMDGLDTYIADYSIADPIPEAMMKTLYQAREHLFSEEEKALADAADAADAAEEAAAEELRLQLEALDEQPATGEPDAGPAVAESAESAQSVPPEIASNERKDA